MNYARKIVVGIACGLLPLLLFFFGLSFSLQRALGTPDTIKHALAESGIYDTVVNTVLSQAQKDMATDNNTAAGAVPADIPLQQAEVQTAIKQAFPASSLQPQVEKALDSTYAWLEGKSDTLEISLDLGQSKEQLAANLTTYAKDKASALPVCPPNTPITADINIFTAPCRPAAVSPDQAAAMTQAKLDQNEFFTRPTIDLTGVKDQQGQALGDRLSNVPPVYQKITTAILICGILAVTCILAAIFVSQPRRTGLRRVAKISLSVGLTTVILACVSVPLSNKAVNLLANSTNGSATFQASIADFLRIIISDIRGWWLAYGIILTFLGIATLIALRIWKEKEIIEHTESLPPENRPHVVTN